MVKGTANIILAFICIISTFLLIAFVQPNYHSSNPCIIENTSFEGGEELVYRVYYNWKIVWIPAGEVRFRVQDKGDVYLLEAVGKSYTSYDNFFRVNDYYATTVDKETLKPLTFVRYIEEGNYRKYDSLSFEQNVGLVQSYNGKTKATAKHKEFEIDSCALDLLSVMYTLRNTNVDAYQPGEFLDIIMFIDEERYPIHVVYEERESKKIKGLGKYSTLKIKPELVVGNVFKKGDVMNIWVSDDENKIPLLIESPISIGSVKAVLKSYSGLRHPTMLDEN
ncbi:MAG: DUF3108 domain-containing protein [Saprospiraceae bacterium]|nr:DUF3108 domain-containing protein [Saprospiraceae bacterium]